jgi:ribonuclease BN (tRNA processing enzyme)
MTDIYHIQVAILGDTIVSTPLAPLALNCDVIAHEATFMTGQEEVVLL